MAGEESGKFKLTPKDALKFISDLTDFIRNTEKDEAERQRVLSSEPDETLREILSISSDNAATEKFLTKLQSVLPPMIDLLGEYATQDEFDQFIQDFNTAMNGIHSELEARKQKLNDINADLK